MGYSENFIFYYSSESPAPSSGCGPEGGGNALKKLFANCHYITEEGNFFFLLNFIEILNVFLIVPFYVKFHNCTMNYAFCWLIGI